MIFDIAPTELLVLGGVALLVIPPKDLPKAMRIAGQWMGRARGMARTFRSGFDDMIRESEFQEMEKKWRAENERIMREHPPAADQAALMAPVPPDDAGPPSVTADAPPVMVEQPALTPEPPVAAPESPVAKTARKPRATSATKAAAKPRAASSAKASAKPRAAKPKP